MMLAPTRARRGSMLRYRHDDEEDDLAFCGMAMTGNSKHLLFAAKNDDRLVGIYSYTTMGSGKPQPGGVRTRLLLRACTSLLGEQDDL